MCKGVCDADLPAQIFRRCYKAQERRVENPVSVLGDQQSRYCPDHNISHVNQNHDDNIDELSQRNPTQTHLELLREREKARITLREPRWFSMASLYSKPIQEVYKSNIIKKLVQFYLHTVKLWHFTVCLYCYTVAPLHHVATLTTDPTCKSEQLQGLFLDVLASVLHVILFVTALGL